MDDGVHHSRFDPRPASSRVFKASRKDRLELLGIGLRVDHWIAYILTNNAVEGGACSNPASSAVTRPGTTSGLPPNLLRQILLVAATAAAYRQASSGASLD